MTLSVQKQNELGDELQKILGSWSGGIVSISMDDIEAFSKMKKKCKNDPYGIKLYCLMRGRWER